MHRSNSGTELKISDLSRLTGVPVSTLRVWGERGLLTPRATPAGYRIYTQDHVKQVADIKRLRTLQGLSIAAIKAALPNGETPSSRSTEEPQPEKNQVSANNSVGDKLRSLRQSRKLTIREVAHQTGIPQSVLASIERTSLGVQIPEAKTLASFYGVTITSLMATPLTEDNKEVISASEGGQVLPTLGKGLRIEQLATGRDMMDCQRWFIEPGVNSHGGYSHDGEEFVYVLFGEFRITIEETRVHQLRQGESIYFKSNWKHAWSNPGQTTTVLIWVNTPPSF